MNTHNNNDAHLENPDTGYDRTDLSATGVLGFLVGLALVMLLIHIVLWGMYRYLDHYQANRQPRLSPLQTVHAEGRAHESVERFPLPRLQADPVADLNKYRFQQDYLLGSYGQSSAPGGAVRIPIERAMDLLVQQGLPTRPQAAAPDTGNPALGASAARAAAPGEKQANSERKKPAQ
jgi:hypothetical protein